MNDHINFSQIIAISCLQFWRCLLQLATYILYTCIEPRTPCSIKYREMGSYASIGYNNPTKVPNDSLFCDYVGGGAVFLPIKIKQNKLITNLFNEVKYNKEMFSFHSESWMGEQLLTKSTYRQPFERFVDKHS